MADDRITATVMQSFPSHALALDDWGVTYFILYNAVQTTGQYAFADLRVGSQVRLTRIDHPKGPRGIEVEVLAL